MVSIAATNYTNWVKNLLAIFAFPKKGYSFFLTLDKLRTLFGENSWLTGRHATPLVTLWFAITMLLTGHHAMLAVI